MKSEWPSENILLGLLAERPMHGYELAQRVRADEALRAIWRIERSEVYYLLSKLQKSGCIAASGESQDRGPARYLYSATEAGRMALDQWLLTPEQYPRNLRTALLARIYVALRRDPSIALDLIAAQRQKLEEWLVWARQRRPENEVVAVVHEFRAAQVEATITALEGLRNLALSRQAAGDLAGGGR